MDKTTLTEKLGLVQIDPRLLSIHALNSFVRYNSSPRSVMMASHLAQALTLTNGDEKIVQSGIERELAGQTFAKKFKNESRIIASVPRYRSGVEKDSINYTTEIAIIFEDLVTGEIDVLQVPYNSSFHQYFGFKYKWDVKLLEQMVPNTIVPAGTIVADSPAVESNQGYKLGANLNVLMLALPEVSEDGVVISVSAAKKLSIKIFEKRVVEFGKIKFPINLYGTEDVYKPFPEIGEQVHESGALMVLRENVDNFSPALLSKKQMLEFDTMFDEVSYAREPGGTVVDIKAYHSPKFKRKAMGQTSEHVDKYSNGFILYYKDLLAVYESIETDYRKKNNAGNMVFSSEFTRLILDAYAITSAADESPSNDGLNKRIKKVHKKEDIDIHRLEFTIEYDLTPTTGYKLTGLAGDKSVMVEIRPDDEMPYDKNGLRADIVTDPGGTIGRMNIGRLYEAYTAASSRRVKSMVTEAILNINPNANPILTLGKLSNKDLMDIFSIPLGLLKIFGTVQYDTYKRITDIDVIVTILKEIVEKELYIFYAVDSVKPAYEIVAEIAESIYLPRKDNIFIHTPSGFKESTDPAIITPLYILLLCKIGDTWLSTPSAKVNHFGLPIGVSNADKHRLPWRNSPTRILSETETRLVASYADEKALIELKDRANSITTHEHLYKNILEAKHPTNVDSLVDRNVQPYGEDKALETIISLFNAGGVEIQYAPDADVHKPYKGKAIK